MQYSFMARKGLALAALSIAVSGCAWFGGSKPAAPAVPATPVPPPVPVVVRPVVLPPPAENQIEQRLLLLKRLHDNGLLTNEEYAAKRAQLVKDL